MDEKRLEKILKALANRRRIMILKLLSEKRMSVGQIAAKIKLSLRATSRHLSILSAQDILDREQISLQVFYSVSKSVPEIIPKILSV